MLQLKSKKAIVTGGTAGIGKEIALTLASQGADVAAWGTSSEKCVQLLQELENIRLFPEQQFFTQPVDVSDKATVDQATEKLLDTWGAIDILINNAGITRDGLLMKMKEEDWDRVMAVNLKSVYNCSQAVIRSMLKKRRGRIINISSIVGLTGNAGQVNYAASKAGMIGFTKSLAQEVASRGICVNCVAPGFIKTAMTEILTEAQKEEFLKQIPMGILGHPKDIARAVLFFASDLSTYITGQVLAVDGGMVM